jgi:phage-related protein
MVARPPRPAVCASIYRCWRAALKEIVRVPEASRKLTFPISLKQVHLGGTSAGDRWISGVGKQVRALKLLLSNGLRFKP